jgi:hypothetical protein
MNGLFGDDSPQPKKKVVDRILNGKPTKEQLLANMVRGGSADFSLVNVSKKQVKQDRGVIEPPIDYINDERTEER